jgi:DNA repair protein RadC
MTTSNTSSYKPRLKSLPIKEQPISRIYDFGVASVSLTELLAAVAGGSRQLELAERLLVHYRTLSALFQAPTTELEQFAGIGHATAARLKAALELGKRLVQETPDARPSVRSPADAANLVMHDMALLEKEELRVILLDTKNHVLGVTTVYVGNVNSSIIRVAEVFQEAVRVVAPSIIIVHNHPSGSPDPSPEDVRVNEQLVEAGKLLNIDVLDHLIIGKWGQFTSLKERRLGFA